MKSKTTNKNKFLVITMFPFRALTKARDVYVKGMMNYGDRMAGVSMIETTGLCAVARRCDFENEVKELVRAASTQSTGDRLGQRSPMTVSSKTTSYALESIDEDKPCLYSGEVGSFDGAKKQVKSPRSKNHAQSGGRIDESTTSSFDGK